MKFLKARITNFKRPRSDAKANIWDINISNVKALEFLFDVKLSNRFNRLFPFDNKVSSKRRNATPNIWLINSDY